MTDQLTLLPEDTLVSRSASPGSDKARATTVTSGQLCLASSKSTGHLGSLEKMLLATSVWGSMMCFLIWKVRRTPSGRLLFQLVPSTPRTDVTEFGLWPTPTASEGTGGQPNKGRTGGKSLRESVLWPTPRAGKTTNENEASWLKRNAAGKVSTPPLEPSSKNVADTPSRGQQSSGPQCNERGLQDKVLREGWHPGNWKAEPGVCRVVDGVPRRVDRLRALGNAVVPQIPEMIGRAILSAS
jgi:hypothetical protein